MSNSAENLGQNIGKLYRESTSIEADVGGLYAEAISIDNNPIQPGGGGSDNPSVADLATLARSGAASGSLFPFEVVLTQDGNNLDVSVTGSTVYDFSGSFKTPVLKDVASIQSTITSTGTNYVSLTITVSLVSGDNKSVSTAVLSIDPAIPTAGSDEVVIEIAEITVTSSNAQLSGTVDHKTSGAIFYPPVPGYAAYTLGSGYLQTGLGNTESASAGLPSEVTGYILNVKEYFNLKVGDSGSEIIDIDSTSVITGRTIGVREIKNEAGTATGNILATQDVTRGVEWAKYNGSSTAAGSLEIGGANTSDITDINIQLGNNDNYITISGNASAGNTIIGTADDETSWVLKHETNLGYAGLGDGALDAGIHAFQSYSSGDSSLAGFNSQGFFGNPGNSGTGGRFSILCSDLPSTSAGEDQALFREVKVCNNGVPATAYILMTNPIND